MCDYELFFAEDAVICIDESYYLVCTNALKFLEFFNTMMSDCTQFEYYKTKPILWKCMTIDVPYCTSKIFMYMYENIKFNIISHLKPKTILSTKEIIQYLQLLIHLTSESECKNMTKWLCFDNYFWIDDTDFWISLGNCTNFNLILKNFLDNCSINKAILKQAILKTALNANISDIYQNILKYYSIPFGLVSDLKDRFTTNDSNVYMYRKSTDKLYSVEFSTNKIYYFLTYGQMIGSKFRLLDDGETIRLRGINDEYIYVPIKLIYYKKDTYDYFVVGPADSPMNTFVQIFCSGSEKVYLLNGIDGRKNLIIDNS